jgi:hypothetical protein
MAEDDLNDDDILEKKRRTPESMIIGRPKAINESDGA